MNRNTLAALSLTASLSLTLAACGSGGGTAQSPAPAASTPPAASGAPSGGVEDGVLTVGMECAYAPYNWTQMDDSNGAVPVSNVPGAYANGYDVMIAQRICDANGWELEVVSTAWDSLIPALQSGTIDVAIAGQSMTADRMAQVDMAGPYYYADIVCLTTAGSAYAAAQGIADLAGGRCTALVFDVRSEAEVRKFLSPLERVDLLINNAGLAAGLEHIDQGDTADWDAMIDTNVKGLLYVTRVVTPKMVAAGGGHVFNIGSIAGTEAYENGAVYCASKHAVHAISQSMRADLLSSGIKVTEIRPGMVETEFSEVRFHGDKERADRVYDGVTPLTGDDIAEAIAWAAQLPAHMNVNEMVLMPSQQAGAYYTYRKNR